jgi:hypothetical protein
MTTTSRRNKQSPRIFYAMCPYIAMRARYVPNAPLIFVGLARIFFFRAAVFVVHYLQKDIVLNELFRYKAPTNNC